MKDYKRKAVESLVQRAKSHLKNELEKNTLTEGLRKLNVLKKMDKRIDKVLASIEGNRASLKRPLEFLKKIQKRFKINKQRAKLNASEWLDRCGIYALESWLEILYLFYPYQLKIPICHKLNAIQLISRFLISTAEMKTTTFLKWQY